MANGWALLGKNWPASYKVIAEKVMVPFYVLHYINRTDIVQRDFVHFVDAAVIICLITLCAIGYSHVAMTRR